VGSRSSRYTDEDVIRAVARAASIADALRRLGLVPRGGNYRTLRRKIHDLGLDASHFVGQGWRKGSRRPVIPARAIEERLTVNSTCNGNDLRKRLIAAGLKAAVCERCGLDEWNGLPIPLELDHINGRSSDNRIENLRILCPNCHAQTPTYRGKNIGSAD
jgi:hypothetical protein